MASKLPRSPRGQRPERWVARRARREDVRAGGSRGGRPCGRAVHAVHADPPERLRLPPADLVADPGQRGSSVSLAAATRSRRVRAARLVVATPDRRSRRPSRGRWRGRGRRWRTSRAARPARPTRRGRPDAGQRREDARRGSRSRLDGRIAGCGRRRRCASRSGTGRPARRARSGRRRCAGRTCSVRHVAERLAALPADLRPGRSVSGSVTIMEEFIGSQVRCWPRGSR